MTVDEALPIVDRAIDHAILRGLDVERLLRDLLADWAEHGQSRRTEQVIDAILSTAACHAAVRANRTLTMAEMNA